MTAAGASLGSNVTLEVAVRRRRRWEVVGNYSIAEREEALEDARQFEQEAGVDGVTVTKETWRQNENRYDTAVIYRSEALEKELAKQRAKDAAANPRPKPKPATAAKPAKPAKPAGKRTAPEAAGLPFAKALPMMAIAFLISCILGAVVAVGLSFPLSHAARVGLNFTRETFNLILIASFVIVAGMTFSIQLRRILKRMEGSRTRRRRAAAPMPRPVVAAPAASPLDAPAPETASVVSAASIPPVDEHPASVPVAEHAASGAASEHAAHTAAAEEEPVLNMKPVLPPGPNEPITAFFSFDDGVRKQLADAGRSLDAAQRFAMALYLTGAAERLGSDKKIARDELAPAVAERLRIVGIGAERADTFRDRLDEYLDQPRCVAVYQAGRDAMARFLDEDPEAIDLDEMLATWDRPAGAKAAKKDDIVAVMFTDIVGSTATTQALGDNEAQALVRAHNHIVREVLKRLDGHEVKHTGDGIMASFAVPSRAVDAAVAIQTAVEAHGKADAERAFTLRIGINAGEPIREDGDLFSATVQLAARLCAKAAEGEIIVSGVVRGLCTGKKHRFESRGSARLKGFNDPVDLFAVARSAEDAADAA